MKEPTNPHDVEPEGGRSELLRREKPVPRPAQEILGHLEQMILNFSDGISSAVGAEAAEVASRHLSGILDTIHRLVAMDIVPKEELDALRKMIRALDIPSIAVDIHKAADDNPSMTSEQIEDMIQRIVEFSHVVINSARVSSVRAENEMK